MFREFQTIPDFDSASSTLIPMGTKEDPFWQSSARTIFSAVAYRQKKSGNHSYNALLRTLLAIDLKALREYLAGTEASNLVEEKVEKTAISIRSVLTNYVKALRYLQGIERSGKKPFTIRDWMSSVNDPQIKQHSWPAYDRSGHQQGVWLSEIRQDGDGRLQGISENGRLLGAESAELIVLQQSRSGITHQVSGQQEALKLAAAYPESGVVLTAEKEHMPDWLLQKLTQGQRPDNVEAVPLSQTQDSTVVVLQTPEEKARQAAKQAIREALRQDRDIILPDRAEKSERDALIQQGMEQELRRSDRELRQEERETERQAVREIQAAKGITAQEHLRELEKEIVLTREKTL